MVCALCKLEKKLCDSHIVPEFMYQELYDKNHSFMAISLHPVDANQHFKKGLREYLLCNGCETKLNNWETYAADFFFGNKNQPIIKEQLFYFENLNYKKLKLFFLSLLWRFSVTSLPEFQGVKLPDMHKERLRLMLLNEAPGTALEYPCFLEVLTHKKQNLSNFIMPPMAAKSDAHHVYQFVIAGFHFVFFVSSHPVTNDMAKTFLTTEGKMIVLMDELSKLKPIYDFYLELGAALIQRKQIPKSELRWRRK